MTEPGKKPSLKALIDAVGTTDCLFVRADNIEIALVNADFFDMIHDEYRARRGSNREYGMTSANKAGDTADKENQSVAKIINSVGSEPVYISRPDGERIVLIEAETYNTIRREHADLHTTVAEPGTPEHDDIISMIAEED